jgi:hypothetical protein
MTTWYSSRCCATASSRCHRQPGGNAFYADRCCFAARFRRPRPGGVQGAGQIRRQAMTGTRWAARGAPCGGQAPWAPRVRPKCPGRLRHGGAPGRVHQRADAASAAGSRRRAARMPAQAANALSAFRQHRQRRCRRPRRAGGPTPRQPGCGARLRPQDAEASMRRREAVAAARTACRTSAARPSTQPGRPGRRVTAVSKSARARSWRGGRRAAAMNQRILAPIDRGIARAGLSPPPARTGADAGRHVHSDVICAAMLSRQGSRCGDRSAAAWPRRGAPTAARARWPSLCNGRSTGDRRAAAGRRSSSLRLPRPRWREATPRAAANRRRNLR